ncbi:lantibiotic dehydratase [Micromonospora sp. NPDC048930]|uniref:lantibiotic dehydratase n=1 Tax=Micromonospora sp. NPDC048930 TaxID=3364261 RepID=UPI003712BD76
MYRHLDALVVRAAVCPPDRSSGGWPDLTESAAGATSWRPWLQQALAVPEFAAALEQASPVLAERVRAICDGRSVGGREARRVVVSVLRYLLRARGRATPYGLFAGVAPAHLAPTAGVRIGGGHRAVARVRAQWLAALIGRLEADPVLLPHLTVRANNLLTCHDDQIVLEHRPNQAPGETVTHVHVRATGPVRAALAAARDPIRLEDLAGKLATDHRVPTSTVHSMLAEMVLQRLLLTHLRPATTSTDPLSVVTAGLEQVVADADDSTAGHGRLAQARATLGMLRTLVEQSAQHNASPHGTGEQRMRLAATMAALHRTDESPVVVDVHVDVDLRVPEAVAVEAVTAAGVLTRLAAPGRAGWAAWHRRFLERYGPHTLVPVRDAVDADIGLGYPAGYRGAPPVPPVALTPRDRKLLALAQEAALRRQHEVMLDDSMIRDLAGEEPITQVQPSTELTVAVHARTMRELDQGDFRLAVVGVSRNAGTTTGRFLDLFNPADRARIAGQYATLPTTTRGALLAQVSAVTPYTITEDVARAPQVMPHLISLGEYHDNAPDRIGLDDIAVTADADRVYLVSISRRCPVEPIVLNAVEQVHYTLPIVRFLAEASTASTAFTAPCSAFDWGVANGLPFLPALRYRRTILSPARWLLQAADLPAPAAGWRQWIQAVAAWRDTAGCPPAVYLGDGDQRIGLDLAKPAHQALLRDHLSRTTTAVLRATPPPDAAGWIDGYAHEIVIPLASTVDPAPPPRLLATAPMIDVREHGHLPGSGDHLYVKLYGHPDRQSTILTRHLPSLLQQLSPRVRWWFLRYGDPEPHLRLRLAGDASSVLVGEWAQDLRRAGLIARVQVDTDYPETARFGGPTASTATGDVFAADSAAALAQLAADGDRRPASDVRAVTAASLLDITTALIGDTALGMQWLIDHARPHRPAPPRDVYDHAVRLANPDRSGLAELPGGEEVRAAWDRRRRALTTYRDTLRTVAVTPAAVLPDLLHLHHTRMIGPDPDSERTCLHLARAAALSWTARARSRT